jgi:hypothetical protein
MKEESLEEFLKKVIPATEEDIRAVAASKNRPPPSPEKVEAQLRAGGAFRGTAGENASDKKNGSDDNNQRGV